MRSVSNTKSSMGHCNSPTSCLKFSVSLLIYVVLLDGKYLVRNMAFSSTQVVMEFDNRDSSHAQALSYKENGNNLSRIAEGSIFLRFVKSTNIDKCRLGVSVGNPENWFC